jgi:hypothetical protein
MQLLGIQPVNMSLEDRLTNDFLMDIENQKPIHRRNIKNKKHSKRVKKVKKTKTRTKNRN